MLYRFVLRRIALTVVLASCHPVLATSIWEMVNEVSEDAYRSFLGDPIFHDVLYTGNGQTRGTVAGSQHDAARDNILQAFTDWGLEAFLDSGVFDGISYTNVVGIHRGLLRPDEILILGAHYDSVNEGPGADDDASGVAGVMEAARVLSQYDFASTLVFIAFDQEERGLIGSEGYARDHAADNILGMAALDMIAYNPLGPHHNNLSLVSGSGNPPPELQRIKYEMAEAVTLFGNGIVPRVYGSMGGSDHDPFRWHNFQSVLMIEHEWQHNPYYHTARDSVDTPDYIDYAFATNVTRAAVGFFAWHAGAVPEPGTLIAFAAGLGAMILLAYRRRVAAAVERAAADGRG